MSLNKKTLTVLGNFALNAKLNGSDENEQRKEVMLMLKTLKKWAKENKVSELLEEYQEEIDLIGLRFAKEEDGILVTNEKGFYRYDRENAMQMVKAKNAFFKEPSGVEPPKLELTETVRANLPNEILNYLEN